MDTRRQGVRARRKLLGLWVTRAISSYARVRSVLASVMTEATRVAAISCGRRRTLLLCGSIMTPDNETYAVLLACTENFLGGGWPGDHQSNRVRPRRRDLENPPWHFPPLCRPPFTSLRTPLVAHFNTSDNGTYVWTRSQPTCTNPTHSSEIEQDARKTYPDPKSLRYCPLPYDHPGKSLGRCAGPTHHRLRDPNIERSAPHQAPWLNAISSSHRSAQSKYPRRYEEVAPDFPGTPAGVLRGACLSSRSRQAGTWPTPRPSSIGRAVTPGQISAPRESP